jgi:3-oxoacyl-[acyl-carrier-protein] synthase-3
MKPSIGILGVGAHLPAQVRTNDYWAPEVVQKWHERLARRVERVDALFAQTPGEGAVLAKDAMAELASDPFQGGRERRALSPGELAADIETEAARQAIANAGIDPAEIGLVLGFTLCPDYINVPGACIVHHRLGLSPKCISMNVDAVCNSFMMQVTIAQDMLAAGRAKYALLVQGSGITRLPTSNEPHDSWLGDGATAVVLGPVADGKGILSFATRTDGSLHGALVCGVPGGRWCDGKPITYSEDHTANFNMFARIVDRAKEVVDEAIALAGVRHEDVGFYACHQAMLWLREVSQKFIGLPNARSVDTFPWAGTISAANLPLVLSIGQKEGLLRDGDLVALFQGGTGMTWSGMMVRWGT